MRDSGLVRDLSGFGLTGTLVMAGVASIVILALGSSLSTAQKGQRTLIAGSELENLYNLVGMALGDEYRCWSSLQNQVFDPGNDPASGTPVQNAVIVKYPCAREAVSCPPPNQRSDLLVENMQVQRDVRITSVRLVRDPDLANGYNPQVNEYVAVLQIRAEKKGLLGSPVLERSRKLYVTIDPTSRKITACSAAPSVSPGVAGYYVRTAGDNMHGPLAIAPPFDPAREPATNLSVVGKVAILASPRPLPVQAMSMLHVERNRPGKIGVTVRNTDPLGYPSYQLDIGIPLARTELSLHTPFDPFATLKSSAKLSTQAPNLVIAAGVSPGQGAIRFFTESYTDAKKQKMMLTGEGRLLLGADLDPDDNPATPEIDESLMARMQVESRSEMTHILVRNSGTGAGPLGDAPPFTAGIFAKSREASRLDPTIGFEGKTGFAVDPSPARGIFSTLMPELQIWNGYQNGGNTGAVTVKVHDSVHMTIQDPAAVGPPLNSVPHGVATVTVESGLQVTGDLFVHGSLKLAQGNSWTDVLSDRRVKKNIRPFSDGLSELLSVQTVRYQYNGLGETENDGRERVGVIAQDLEAIFPYMVGTSSRMLRAGDARASQVRTVDPGAFTYVLINSVQELSRENTGLKLTLERQAQQIQDLASRMDALEQRLQER